MTAQTILPANSVVSGGYEVANSARFNDGDSAYMHKTAAGGNRRTFTFSTWLKRGQLGTNQQLFNCWSANNAAGFGYIQFVATESNVIGDRISLEVYGSQILRTTQVLTDPNAWYHLVVAVDTTNDTANNRCRMYLNGTEITSFAARNNPDENFDFAFNQNNIDMYLGSNNYGGTKGNYFDGYLAETVWIDGSQLAADSFGEFDSDSGIWKPIDVSGLTFGTNGFYLDYQASGNLGNDVNGGTDLTEVNFAATDQTTDTCTNNFAVINSLENFFGKATLSEGNTRVLTNAGAEAMNTSSIAVSAGRWYFEVDFISNSGNVSRQCGITPTPSFATSAHGTGGDVTPHVHAYSDSGNLQTGNGSGGQNALATLSSFTNGDLIGIYLDLEDMKSYWSKNGTLMNSGTGIALTALASLPYGTGQYMFYVGDNNGAAQTCQANFGNPHVALDNTAVSDDNGYGAFEYSPNITGDGTAKSFYALCTKNVAEFG